MPYERRGGVVIFRIAGERHAWFAASDDGATRVVIRGVGPQALVPVIEGVIAARHLDDILAAVARGVDLPEP